MAPPQTGMFGNSFFCAMLYEVHAGAADVDLVFSCDGTSFFGGGEDGVFVRGFDVYRAKAFGAAV